MMKHEGIWTPWGRSQGGNTYMPGVDFYHTASHGGIKLALTLNEQIPPPFRNPEGWYEEDCEFAIPFYFFHDALREHCLKHGLQGHTMSAEDWFGKYDKAYYLGVIERYCRAACVLHFGTQYSDEQLSQSFTNRTELEREIAEIQLRIGAFSTPRTRTQEAVCRASI